MEGVHDNASAFIENLKPASVNFLNQAESFIRKQHVSNSW